MAAAGIDVYFNIIQSTKYSVKPVSWNKQSLHNMMGLSVE
jgi:hypothetical protein